MERRLFTSESVTEGHPDKVCDLIADSILDEIFAQDSEARCAVEVCCTTNYVFIFGEVSTSAKCDYEKVARDVIKNIGYEVEGIGFDYKTCKIKVAIDEALKCKETGEAKNIVFGLTGTGYFDMVAYQKYNDGEMSDYIPTDDDLKKAISQLPKVE